MNFRKLKIFYEIAMELNMTRVAKKLYKDDIVNERLIMREEGSGTREIVESFLKNNNINYNVFMELGNTMKSFIDYANQYTISE